ncbi:MAG: hypothetical protein K2R98_27350 [Gemmataceae bacterium]|nr:hypothetical protein [Gemmataceae bacterium]
MTVQLMTLDPGHFHAALVQKEMVDGVAPEVHVYAPLGPDLLAHLGRIAGFNNRAAHPTRWQLEVHATPDFQERLLREKPGNVVVLSGRNRGKIDSIVAAVHAGLNVLADKPWVIVPADLAKLEAALNEAEQRGLVAYDIMTERYEITSMLQREFVTDAATFGDAERGSEAEPGVFMESVHFLLKLVAGVPNRRPPWFFDVHQQGEGLTDVGTHLVDLVPWVLFPEQAIDHRNDVRVLAGQRWPTSMTRENFQQVTGEADFPSYLTGELRNGALDYFCNNEVRYTLRGIHVQLRALWDFEAAVGAGDTHLAVFRGSRSRVEVRQGKEQHYRPELYVVPSHDGVRAAVTRKVESLQKQYPGVALHDLGSEFHIEIPQTYRVGHEAHFGEVMRQFLQYLRAPRTVPAWEKANMLAKYFVTTESVAKARRS